MCKHNWFRCWGIAIERNSTQKMCCTGNQGDPALAEGPFSLVVVICCPCHKSLRTVNCHVMSNFLKEIQKTFLVQINCPRLPKQLKQSSSKSLFLPCWLLLIKYLLLLFKSTSGEFSAIFFFFIYNFC